MPPTPLETYWTGRVAALATAKTQAVADFGAAQSALTAARGTRTADTEALAALARDLDARRRALAEPNLTPAELAARVAALRAQRVMFRAKHRTVLAGDAAVDLGTRLLAARQAEVERAVGAHQEAQAAAAAAAARVARWAQVATALGQEPLLSLKTRATNATKPTDAAWSAAKARVEAEIPKELRERAAERWSAVLAEPAAADAARTEIEDLLAAARAPETGDTPAAETALVTAEGALAGYLQRGEARFAAAQDLLEAIPESSAPTAADLAAMTEATRVANGKAAALLEEARDDKAAELGAKRAERETAKRTALAADIDADLPTVLAALDGQVTTLEGELATAQAAYDAVAGDLEEWEATMPESAWANLRAFETARRELGELAATVPANLLTALDTATTALVAALTGDDERARTLAYLHRETAAERDRHEVVLAFTDRRANGALRGE